jgi:hypothetical protein
MTNKKCLFNSIGSTNFIIGGRSYICYLLNSTTKFFKINFPFPIWIQQLNYTNYFLKLDQ